MSSVMICFMFVITRVFRVWCLLCLGFDVSSIIHLGFVVSSVCLGFDIIPLKLKVTKNIEMYYVHVFGKIVTFTGKTYVYKLFSLLMKIKSYVTN